MTVTHLKESDMPRIQAATVAEHHAMRRAALLSSGLRILGENGPTALTPQAVGAAAGIARSSVYQYFSTSEELFDAVVDFAFEVAQRELLAALEGDRTPGERVLHYATVAFDNATDATHRGFSSLADLDLTADQRRRVDAHHLAMTAPLAEALRDLGADNPELRASLIEGMVAAAARRAREGHSAAEARTLLLNAITAGPAPLAAASTP
jgi:AcrR family transcriptional regulator